MAEGLTAAPKQQAKLKEVVAAKPCTPAAQQHSTEVAFEGVEKLALPSTRQLAKEMNINIDLVQGTGKAGRVTPDDLRSTLPINLQRKCNSSLTHLPEIGRSAYYWD